MWPVDSLYLLMLGSGLLGGFGHCIGMCGPIVAAYSFGASGPGVIREGARPERYILPHLLYNLGRITTYTVLGGIVGFAGSFAVIAKALEGSQRIVLAAAGMATVLMGLSVGRWLPLVKRIESASGLSNAVVSVTKFISGARSIGAYYPLGLTFGFIPCGLLYTALIAAAGLGIQTGSWVEGFLRGGLLLFLFGLGTSPAMFLLGSLVSAKGEWLRAKFYKGSALLMVLVGFILVYRALKR